MNRTPIPWVVEPDGTPGLTWNPTTGCTFGCEWCYARRIAQRFGAATERGRALGKATPTSTPFPYGFTPTIYPHRLDEPLRRKAPATIFISSMGDLFDPAIPDSYVRWVMQVCARASQHRFVLLTKRVERMHDFFAACLPELPMPPHLVIGVSVTCQADADRRVPLLLGIPAARRMVSVEPMSGPVSLPIGSAYRHQAGRLDLVVIGGMTPGPALHEQHGCERCRRSDACGRREPGCRREDSPATWLRDLLRRCAEAEIPVCYKHGQANPAVDGMVYDATIASIV